MARKRKEQDAAADFFGEEDLAWLDEADEEGTVHPPSQEASVEEVVARGRTPTGEPPRIVVPEAPSVPLVEEETQPLPPPEPTPAPEPAVRAPAAVNVPGQPTPGPSVDRHRLPSRAKVPAVVPPAPAPKRRPAEPLPPFVHREGTEAWREVVEILTAEARARTGSESATLLADAAQVALLQVGDLELARERMNAALAADPSRADHHRLYARIVRRLAWTEEEILALRSAAAKDPDDLRSRARLLELLPRESRDERARIAGELASLVGETLAADLYTLQGDLEAADGRKDAARSAYEAALAAEPENGAAFVGLEALLATDRAGQAALFEREAAHARALGRSDRERAFWLLQAARAWRAASRADRARSALREAHAVGSAEAAAALEALEVATGEVAARDALLRSEVDQPSPGRAFTAFRLGWLREQEGDAAGAVEAYGAAVLDDPSALPALDAALRLLRDDPEARRALLAARASSVDPATSPWTFLALAEHHEHAGDLDRAREGYVAVLDTVLTGAAVVVAWSGLERTLERTAAAGESLDRLSRRIGIAMEQTSAASLHAAVLHGTARTLVERFGRAQEARSCAAAALRADPTLQGARWLLQRIASDPAPEDAAADFRDRASLTTDPRVRGWYRFAAGVAAEGAAGRDDLEVTLAELPGHAGAARALEVALAAGDETEQLADLYAARARAGDAWSACTAATLLSPIGRVEEAIALLEQVPELVADADDGPTRVAARLALRLGAIEQAAEILSGADDDRDQAERAWLLHRLGHSREALSIVLAIAEDGEGVPDPVATAARGAEIALAAGDTAAASRLLDRVAERASAPAVRAAYAERAAEIRGDPMADAPSSHLTDLGERIVAARRHETEGQWSSAYAGLLAWRELALDPAVRLGADARRRWLLAEKLSETDEAWDLYRALHEDIPDDREITETLAGIASARGESALAVRYLEELVASSSDPADAARLRVRIARLHEEGGSTSSAREAYLDVLAHTPDSRDAVDGLRRVAVSSGDWPSLVAVLEREAADATPQRAVEIRAEIARVVEDKVQDLPAALERWRAVLELDPDHAEATARLLAVAEQLGEWGLFVEVGEAHAPQLPPEQSASLWRRIGIACQDQLGRDDAVRFFEEAVAVSPPDLEAARRLEGLARVQGEWPQVVRTLELQAEAEPDAEGKRAALARAARIQVESLQDHDAAAATYRRILQIHPDDEQALRFIGQHLYEQGAFDDALEVFERLDPVAEQGQDLEDFDTRIELSGFYFMFADLLAQRGEIDAALVRYERALALNPTHLQSLEAVAPLYTDRRQWAKAERVYRQLLQLTGGQGDKLRVASTYTALGLVERELGATDKAYKRFAKALELHPHDVGALKGMALVLEDKQDWSNLLSVYNNIIHYANLPTDVIDAYMTKGRILDVHMQRQDKAAQHYQRSLDFDPNQPEAWLRLAELAARRGAWNEAGDLADKGLDLSDTVVDPYRARLLLIRAAAWQGTGHPQRAEDFLSRAVARDPDVVQDLGSTPLGNLDQVQLRLRALTAGG